uniref:Reverse transcriptase domain-containing protein n=1 Tax=Tanacetum cinerariifolium TaxID=118510 RepID=A0A699L0R2_TANCI|nr:hypothetical protein [Tanacetum cinerariifolium]
MFTRSQRLPKGIGTPKPVSMVIEMIDRSMQSLKGKVENVLVKIDKFIFLVDFVVLDIVEDNKVPIIIGRPMLATAHTRINVFSRKISLEVGTEKVVFNVNKGKTRLSVCVINNFQVPEDFGEPKGLEEFLMNDEINEDLRDFLEENDLLPGIDLDSFEVLPDSDGEIRIRLEDLGEGIENFWDA